MNSHVDGVNSDYSRESCAPVQEKSPIWFSHRERKFSVNKLLGKRVFKWTENIQMWNWDNCFISATKRKDGKIRVVVRSSQLIDSDYRKKKVNLKYMLGFDITQIRNLEEDEYDEPIDNLKQIKGHARPRWYLELDKDHFIWQWQEGSNSKLTCDLATIREALKNTQDQPYDPVKSEIFNARIYRDDSRIIPVIYQPAIDSWKNFLREVHCKRLDSNRIKVTLLFNDEHLRKHGYFDIIYRFLRLIIYRRVADIETFIINLEEGVPNKFEFPNIFSGERSLEYDSVHQNGAFHKIKYYFANKIRPIVFINTANHAMSFHDTNHRIWKWEYTPWEDNSPVIFGEKSREEIESAIRKGIFKK